MASDNNFRIFGFSPKAAVQKLAGRKDADVLSNYDGGGRIQPGNVLGSATTVALGSQTTPNQPSVRTESSSNYPAAYNSDGSPIWDSSDIHRSNDTSTVDPAAQQAAARAAALKAQANPLQQALAALDTTLANRLSEVDSEYNTNMRRYKDAYAQDRARYDENVASNEGQLMSQRQNKLVAGARLGANLRSILGSLGALNGTGAFLGNEAVRGITNAGLGEARDAFDTNAKVINDNWSTADQEHRQRQEDAESIREAARANTRADVLSSRQQILNQLGNLFGADTAEGARYLGDAGALYSQIANTTRPNVAAYQKASTLFSPAALQGYLSGIGNTQVSTAPGAGSNIPLNSPLYAGPRRREEQLV